MRTNQSSIKRNFPIIGVLGLCTFLGLQLAGLPEIAQGAGPFGQKEPNMQYRLVGKIVNAQGDTYVIRKPSGEKVKITVTDDTNMFCEGSAGKSEKSVMTGNVDFEPDKGTTKGFRIGNCPPVPGQYIKAETTDVGTVTFLRTVDASRAQDQTVRLGLPQKFSVAGFAIFPVVREGLGQKVLENHDVLTSDGHKIGNLKKIIIDTKTGNIVYGIVKLDQEAIQATGFEISSGSLMPLPWGTFHTSEKDKAMKLELSAQQLANVPGYGDDSMTIADVRAYWELEDPRDIGVPQPHYMGADRVDEMELKKARQNYKAAREHFYSLETVYADDIKELERAKEKFDNALVEYAIAQGTGGETVQQKLQDQIFR